MAASPSSKMPPFDPADPLGIDDLLEPEDLAVRDTVRSWAADRVLPHIAEWYENGELPGIRALARELGGIGALGMSLSGYGCAGASAVQYGLACLELEAADSGIRSLVSGQGSLAMYAIRRFGSEEQKQEWLPRMAAGEVIGGFGLTEPHAGSDPPAMRDPPSPAPAPARRPCGHAPGRTATTGSSTVPRCGSRMRPSPTSPWSGRGRRRVCAASSSRRRRRGSRPRRSPASFHCGRP